MKNAFSNSNTILLLYRVTTRTWTRCRFDHCDHILSQKYYIKFFIQFHIEYLLLLLLISFPKAKMYRCWWCGWLEFLHPRKTKSIEWKFMTSAMTRTYSSNMSYRSEGIGIEKKSISSKSLCSLGRVHFLPISLCLCVWHGTNGMHSWILWIEKITAFCSLKYRNKNHTIVPPPLEKKAVSRITTIVLHRQKAHV